MKHATRVTLVFASLYFSASGAFGQTTSAIAQQPPPPSAPHQFTCSTILGPAVGMVASGPVAPYSAVKEFSSLQTLSDGTHISHKQRPEKLYRDSQGRTRTERSFCHGPGDTPDAMLIEIRDPVAGYSYILDEQNHIAHRFALQAQHSVPAHSPTATARTAEPMSTTVISHEEASRPTITTESLGSQTMEGMVVEGTRTTRIIPEGFQDNDRPITSVSESWTSPDLRISILTKTNDPRFGEMTTRLTNIELSNPILSLFQPPPDYKIVDETDRVKLTYTLP
jgi:hypothetical protein